MTRRQADPPERSLRDGQASPTWLDKAQQHANSAAMGLAGLALVLLAVHVSLDALGKYLLSLPIPATLEIVAYYYMPAVAMLPLAHVESRGGHVSLTMVYDRVPRLVQKAFSMVGGLLSLTFLSLLAFLAGREALRKVEIGEYMFGEYPILLWPGRIVFTIGLVLFIFTILVGLVRVLGGRTYQARP
jgi:TRAP-type C4-dicarboxylate transport system permease small subunit